MSAIVSSIPSSLSERKELQHNRHYTRLETVCVASSVGRAMVKGYFLVFKIDLLEKEDYALPFAITR